MERARSFSLPAIQYKRLLGHSMSHGDFHPYSHQAELYNKFDDLNTVIVSTSTSSGKTRAALYSLFDRKLPAIFVYPTNELLLNQAHSIHQALIERGCKVAIEPRNALENEFGSGQANTDRATGDAHIKLLYSSMTSSIVEAGQYEYRRDALIDLIRCEKKRTYLLTNFDIIYFLLQQRFEHYLSALQYLMDYQVIVVDEFHFYKGYDLSNLLYGLYLLSTLKQKSLKIIFLSATPPQDLTKVMKDLYGDIQEIHDKPEFGSLHDDTYYTAVHPIELSMISCDHKRVPETIEEKFGAFVPDIISMKRDTSKKSFSQIPCVIIVNSPVEARGLAQRLRSLVEDKGLDVGEKHGLMSRSDRSRTADILVGTSSIEVGIDFDTSLLVFEANEFSSFIQRLGRAGRHSPSRVVALVPESVFQTCKDYYGGSRTELIETVRGSFEKTDEPLFRYIKSIYGILPVDIAVRRFRGILEKRSKIAQSDAEQGNISEARESATEAISLFESKMNDLGIPARIGSTEINEAYSGRYKFRWMRNVGDLSFRGGEIQVLVLDTQAISKGGTPFYFVPIDRLLRRCSVDLTDLDEREYEKRNLLNDIARDDLKKWEFLCRRKMRNVNEGEFKAFKVRDYSKWFTYSFDLPSERSLDEILVAGHGDLRVDSLGFANEDVADYLSMLLCGELYLVTKSELNLPWRVVAHETRGNEKLYMGASALIAKSYIENQRNS